MYLNIGDEILISTKINVMETKANCSATSGIASIELRVTTVYFMMIIGTVEEE